MGRKRGEGKGRANELLGGREDEEDYTVGNNGSNLSGGFKP